MGGLINALRSITSGVAQAAGNQTAHDDLQKQMADSQQKQAQEQQQAIGPHTQALIQLRNEQMQLVDPKTGQPAKGYEQQYNELTDAMQGNIHAMRTILHPDHNPSPVEHFAQHMTDKLHLTNGLKRANDQTRMQDQGNEQDRQQTQTFQQGAPSQGVAGLNPDEQAQAVRIKAGLTPKDTTEQERFTADYLKRNPGKNLEDALRSYTDATTKDTSGNKPAQEPKPLESGGIMYGVSDPSTGKQYLASQMNDPATPQNIKEIWKTIQDSQTAKKADADKKEQDRDNHFIEAQKNIADRMGRSEEWQAKMADYREQLAGYKTMDQSANKTQTDADTFAAQYKDPNTPDKAAVDTSLLTTYTSVLAQGGRKTQSEIALARNIGDLALNLKTKAYKAFHGGELPPELRKMYLDYINSAAKTQREDANKVKPEPPSVSVPEGPKTKALKEAKSGGGWKPPTDAPAAPKADNKVLKADGKVIAKSKGGQWVDPNAN